MLAVAVTIPADEAVTLMVVLPLPSVVPLPVPTPVRVTNAPLTATPALFTVKTTFVGVPAITLAGLALMVNTGTAFTVMVLAGVIREVLLPDAFVTVSVGYHVPTPYSWTGLELDVLFSQVPSPKLQFHAEMLDPDEVSVKITASGDIPAVVFIVKLATGGDGGEFAVTVVVLLV